MRSLFIVLSAMTVIGLAFWAYRENYQTQATLNEAQRLQSQIANARERLRMLNAEWAYLNRPQRLRELADMNYDRLGLVGLRAEQFGRVDQVAFPPDEIDLPIDSSVEVSNMEQLP